MSIVSPEFSMVSPEFPEFHAMLSGAVVLVPLSEVGKPYPLSWRIPLR